MHSIFFCLTSVSSKSLIKKEKKKEGKWIFGFISS
jgi:hypothetical protein